MSSVGESYQAQWRDLRGRSFLFWMIFLTYLPGVILSVKALDFLAPELGYWMAQWIAVGWGLAWIAAGLYRGAFRCPRCHEWYFSHNGWSAYGARNCVHCGLPRNGSPED